MYRAIHFLVVTFYLAAPVVALVVDAYISIRKGRRAPSSQFVMTTSAAVVLGTTLALIYAIGVGGHVGLGQILLCIYFAAGMLLLLKGFDWLVTRASTWALGRFLDGPGSVARRLAMAGQSLLRVALLFGVGLPYVMAAVMTYRPRVVPRDDPMVQLGLPYERVSFNATDGTRLSGWWIPAIPTPQTRGIRDFGEKTVLACHGLAANKSNQLIIARELVISGYNVLIFDFRAHGESAGQLTSMGDLERRDVLGAVNWLQTNRSEESRRIYGVGASMGAAALIEAAADDSAQGRAIEAIAVYGTFDDLGLLARDIAKDRFFFPFDRLLGTVGLRFAAAQVGADLPRFSPARDIVKLWPRPILVVHGVSDSIIPLERGMRLYQLAMQPKQRMWIERADHNRIINDEDAAKQVRDFFDTARPVQML
jgi:fermentation-respiration switch protein FrsA (DUF1100 family)